MKYNAEQITFMLHEAIDQDREYKSWHVSTKHLMTLVEMVVAEEREARAKVCEDSVEYAGDTLAEAIRARGYKQDGQCKYCTDGCPACDARKLPEQEPVACKECHLKDLVYDLLGDLKVANLKLSVRAQRTWVNLTSEEIGEIYRVGWANNMELARAIEAKLKEKNT